VLAYDTIYTQGDRNNVKQGGMAMSKKYEDVIKLIKERKLR
jgi:hypothetical protein